MLDLHAAVGEALRERAVGGLGRGEPVGHEIQLLLLFPAGLLEAALDLLLPPVADGVDEKPARAKEEESGHGVACEIEAGDHRVAIHA